MTDAGWRASATTTGGGPGRLPSVGWILGTSLWLVPVLFFGGNGAWLGFLVVGALVVRWTWLVAAGVYAIWAIIAATLPDDGARVVASAVLQFVSIIHAMIANRRLLVTIWGRIERGEQWWGPTRSAAVPARSRRRPQDRRVSRRAARRTGADVPAEAEALLAGPGTDRSDYLADPEPAPLPPPRGRRREGTPPAPTGRPSPGPAPAAEAPPVVDVNTATEDDFKALPGFSGRRARMALEARSRRGRFASVQEFADDVGLQPHQLVALRDRLTCSRPRRRSFGRRVDL